MTIEQPDFDKIDCESCGAPLHDGGWSFKIKRAWIYVCGPDCEEAYRRDYADWLCDRYEWEQSREGA